MKYKSKIPYSNKDMDSTSPIPPQGNLESPQDSEVVPGVEIPSSPLRRESVRSIPRSEDSDGAFLQYHSVRSYGDVHVTAFMWYGLTKEEAESIEFQADTMPKMWFENPGLYLRRCFGDHRDSHACQKIRELVDPANLVVVTHEGRPECGDSSWKALPPLSRSAAADEDFPVDPWDTIHGKKRPSPEDEQVPRTDNEFLSAAVKRVDEFSDDSEGSKND